MVHVQERPGAAALPANPRIATLNVLFDLYDYRVTRLELRLPLIANCLVQTEADVILLQVGAQQ